jgi:acyl-CoA thioesterase FadM
MILEGRKIQMNIDIEPYDIDAAGHVNNLACIRWLENMRTRLLAGIIPLKKLLAKNIYPVVISTEAKYKKLIKLFDKPAGSLMLKYYAHGYMILNAVICVKGIPVFTAIQKCVLMDLVSSKMLAAKIRNQIFKDEPEDKIEIKQNNLILN